MNLTVDEPLYEILILLADLFLKGLLILLGARILTGFLARSAAAARHLIWATALIMILMLPLFAAVLPRVSVPLIPQPFEAQMAQQAVQGTSAAPAYPERVVMSPDEAKAALARVRPDDSVASTGPVSSGVRIPADGLLATAPPAETGEAVGWIWSPVLDYLRQAHWTTLVAGLWMLGVGFVLFWTLTGLAGAWWITRRAQLVTASAWEDLMEELADRLMVSRPVTLKMSASISSPMTWGAWRPVVLLPIDADDWSEERRRYVLLHEMSHIKRWDTLTQFGAQLGCALHWFNPMAWQALHRMRIEQEKACDDLVLSHGMKASAYASHLLDIARSLKISWVSPLNTVSMAKPSQLEGRVVDILDPERKRRKLDRLGAVFTCILAFAVMLPITALSPWQPPGDVPASPLMTQGAFPAFPGQPDRQIRTEITWADRETELATLRANAEQALRLDVRAAADTSEKQRKARKTAISALRKSLHDKNPEVRRHAVLTLGEMNDYGAVEALSDLAQSDRDAEVRRFAIMTLSELNADEAIDVYIAALDDRDKLVREYAAHALAVSDERRAVEALVALLDDGDSNMRRHAVMGIIENGGEETTALLIEMLDDRDPEVRRHALFGLADREDEEALPALARVIEDDDPDIRRLAIMALAEYDNATSLRLLRQALKDSDPEVRSHAIIAIADRADEESMPLFIELLEGDRDPEIRKYAAIALGEIGDVEAVDVLSKALQDENSEVRRYATMALSELDYGDEDWDEQTEWLKADDEDDWDHDSDWNHDNDWDHDSDWDNDNDWEGAAAFGEAMAQIGISASQIGLAVGEMSLSLTADALEEVAYSLEGIEFDHLDLAELEHEFALSGLELEEALMELELLGHELEHAWSDEDFDDLLELLDVIAPVLEANPELCEEAASLFEHQDKQKRKRAMKKLSCETSVHWRN